MKNERSLAFLAVIFAVVYAVVYVLAVWKNIALFTYHPVTGALAPGVEKPHEGPAMYWYGWMATAALAAFAACGLAWLLPARVRQQIWSGWAWLAPIGVLLFFVYLLRGYFLR